MDGYETPAVFRMNARVDEPMCSAKSKYAGCAHTQMLVRAHTYCIVFTLERVHTFTKHKLQFDRIPETIQQGDDGGCMHFGS